jgi:hypothetical protein
MQTSVTPRISKTLQILTERVLFICSLFNKALSNSRYTASNQRMIGNYELEKLWKETVVA